MLNDTADTIKKSIMRSFCGSSVGLETCKIQIKTCFKPILSSLGEGPNCTANTNLKKILQLGFPSHVGTNVCIICTCNKKYFADDYIRNVNL